MCDKARIISKEDLIKQLEKLPDGSQICVIQENIYNKHDYAEFYSEPKLQKNNLYAIAFSCDWN